MLLAAMQMLLPGMPFIYYGDEVGMTGGADPDCRRGMLWDPRRQDTELFAYYQKLIRLRKANPCLTEGDPVDQCADDENGVVMIDRGDLVVLFHGRCGTVELPQYKGLHELICDTPFSGILGPYQAALLRK